MMNNAIFFSIIIPTYNRAHLIENTLLSVLNQEFKDYEVLVVDDGSNDKTQLVIENFIHCHKLLNWNYHFKENGERGAARNYGIAKAKGRWITFLDSDDCLYPSHFKIADEFIRTQKKIEIFHSAYEFKNEFGGFCKSVLYPKNNDFNVAILKGNFLSCFGMFIKKEILIDINFCDERAMSGTEDWLLWLQLSARYKIYFQPIVTGCMVLHSERSVLGFNKEQMLNRMNLLIGYLNNDSCFALKYGKHWIVKIEAHMMTYIALHLALENQKKNALKYLLKGIRLNLSEFFSRRTLAIIKYQFIKYSV